jgi:hypothetical protein
MNGDAGPDAVTMRVVLCPGGPVRDVGKCLGDFVEIPAQCGIFIMSVLQFLAMRPQAEVRSLVHSAIISFTLLSLTCQGPITRGAFTPCTVVPEIDSHSIQQHSLATPNTLSARFSKSFSPFPPSQHGHPVPRSSRRNPCPHPLFPTSS